MGEDKREVVESRVHTDSLVGVSGVVFIVHERLLVELKVCTLLYTIKK